MNTCLIVIESLKNGNKVLKSPMEMLRLQKTAFSLKTKLTCLCYRYFHLKKLTLIQSLLVLDLTCYHLFESYICSIYLYLYTVYNKYI